VREGWGYSRHSGERQDLWFPRGTRSSIMDYTRGRRGEAKSGDKINWHSLSPRRIVTRARKH